MFKIQVFVASVTIINRIVPRDYIIISRVEITVEKILLWHLSEVCKLINNKWLYFFTADLD